MYRILLATDGSEHAEKVIAHALKIAEAMKAEVNILTVVGEYVFSPRVSVQFSDDNWKLINQQLKEEADELVEKAAEPFKAKGLTVKTEVVIGHQSPADVICEKAREWDIDLVIMGNRGLRGIKEVFLGSVSNKVAHIGCTSVMIVK